VTEQCTCIALPGDTDAAIDKAEVRLVDGEWHATSCGKARCTFEGVIDGVEVTGRVDALVEHEDGSVTLYDYKSKSPYAARYHRPDDPRLVAQCSINAELARQMGVKVRQVRAVVFFYSQWPAPATDGLWGEPVPLQPIEQVLNMQYDESVSVTVRETLHAAAAARKCTTVAEVLANVPPHGEGMFKGSKCQKYCSHTYVCYPRALGAV